MVDHVVRYGVGCDERECKRELEERRGREADDVVVVAVHLADEHPAKALWVVHTHESVSKALGNGTRGDTWMANPPARSMPSPLSTYALRRDSSFCAKYTFVRSSIDLSISRPVTG